MASTMYTKFCLAIFVVGLLASTTEAKFKNINQFCRTSDYKQICNTMVNGATNLHDATKNAVQSALNVATMLQTMTSQLDQALSTVAPPSKADTLSTCKDTFDEAVDSLKESLAFIDNNDFGGLNSHLSAVVGPSDCQDAFQQAGVAFPPNVANVFDNLTKQVSNCLAVSQQI